MFNSKGNLTIEVVQINWKYSKVYTVVWQCDVVVNSWDGKWLLGIDGVGSSQILVEFSLSHKTKVDHW